MKTRAYKITHKGLTLGIPVLFLAAGLTGCMAEYRTAEPQEWQPLGAVENDDRAATDGSPNGLRVVIGTD